MENQSLGSAAYYEAAHFVIGFYFDQPPESLTVNSNRSRGTLPLNDGYYRCPHSKSNQAPCATEPCEIDIMLSMAGLIAEKKKSDSAIHQQVAAPETEDEIRIAKCLRLNHVRFRQLHSRTESIVREKWNQIELLADALLSAKTIYADVAEFICEMADGEKPSAFVLHAYPFLADVWARHMLALNPNDQSQPV